VIDLNDDSRKRFGRHQEEVTSYEQAPPIRRLQCPPNSYQTMSQLCLSPTVRACIWYGLCECSEHRSWFGSGCLVKRTGCVGAPKRRSVVRRIHVLAFRGV